MGRKPEPLKKLAQVISETFFVIIFKKKKLKNEIKKKCCYLYLYLSFTKLTSSLSRDIVTKSQGIINFPSLHFVRGDLFKCLDFSLRVVADFSC